ncbi:MAG TPA: hypothetical protein VGK53_08715 [Propionicimonas sp.]
MLIFPRRSTPVAGGHARLAQLLTASVTLALLGLTIGAPGQAQAADGALSVVNGTIRATTRAGNLNGTEAVLKGNSSAVTQTVTGTGALYLMARGTSCKGKAKVRVYVDDKKVKDISLSAAKKFTKYTVKKYATVATRTVKVRLINNKGTRKCNRDAFVAGSYMGGVPVTNGTTSTPPTSSDYGVPAGTQLRVVNGDMTITTDGTVLDGIDLHGYLTVNADNVTIKNSVVRGGAKATSTKALIMAWLKPQNLQILRTTLVATNKSIYLDGISGSGYTADGVEIINTVDGAKVIGPNVTIRNSWFHGSYYTKGDPTHPDNQTHNDGIQVEGGYNVVVEDNRIEAFHNAAIQVTQNNQATHNVTVRNNKFTGGGCTINVTDKGAGGNGKPIYAFSLTANGFGPGNFGTTCPMRLPKSSSFSLSGNYWMATGKAAVPQMF